MVILCMLPYSVYGEAIILQSGERIEGTVVRQSNEAVVIEVEVSPGVIDTRTYQRSELKEVQKETPDQLAFQELDTLKPGPNSMMPSDYDEALARLRSFVRNYPDSAFTPGVNENIKALLAEKERVEQGEMKLDNEWLTAEDVRKNRYQIEARSVFEQMRNYAQGGNYVAALNAFDTLETKYPASKVYPQAVPIARQVIRALATDIGRKKVVAEREEAARKKGVEITSEPKKSQLIAANEAEHAQFKALIEQAAAQKIKWPPLIARSPASLEALEKLIGTEENRLAAVDISAMQASLSAVTSAETSLASDNLEGAKAQLEAARKQWPANEAIKIVEEELKAREAEAAAAASQQPQEGSSPAAAPPASPAPASSPRPTGAPGSAETPATSAAAGASPAATASTPVAAVAEKKPVPFFKTIGGAMVIVLGTLVIAALAALIGKVKKPDDLEEPKE